MATQGKDDDSAIIIVVCAALFVGAMMLMQHFNAEINGVLAKIKIVETWPFAFWSSDWKEVTESIQNGTEDLGQIRTATLMGFYNRYAAFAWLPLFAWITWKIWKMNTKENYKHRHTPETLIKASSQIVSSTYPWIYRDITKKDWNYGAWRLMESPLFFLVRNKCILDPSGEPFHYNQVFESGDHPSLYAGEEEASKEIDENRLFKSSSFEEAVRLCEKSLGQKKEDNGDFRLMDREVSQNPEKEINKFKRSSLVPVLNSVYLNKKGRTVLNSIDDAKLRRVLSKQLGEVIGKTKNGKPDESGERDPFAWLKYRAEQDPKEAWRFGLGVALYLHGYADKYKDDAYKIFDSMNYSLGGTGDLDSAKINIKPALGIGLKYSDDYSFRDDVMKHCYYLNPFFMALLKYARRRGVIETGKFSWVRRFDRSLWYSLVQEGRDVCTAEAAGVWSHFWAEQAMGCPLDEPYMQIAVDGFHVEMEKEGYLNIEAERKRTEAFRNAVIVKKRDEEMKKEQGFAEDNEKSFGKRGRGRRI